jgi:hypothetical protein
VVHLGTKSAKTRRCLCATSGVVLVRAVAAPPSAPGTRPRCSIGLSCRSAIKASPQVAPAKKRKPPKPPGKAFIVFGADEYTKPRAARFSAEDPDLLAKAVEAMHLRLVEVTNEDLADIATRLPAGRLHASTVMLADEY